MGHICPAVRHLEEYDLSYIYGAGLLYWNVRRGCIEGRRMPWERSGMPSLNRRGQHPRSDCVLETSSSAQESDPAAIPFPYARRQATTALSATSTPDKSTLHFPHRSRGRATVNLVHAAE
ncbi:unnamed protein product [Peniophora sp. CBMAI 1063]|nr:unnamed protein product [Peniophora sp. CBMAI 1063]